jgi:RHS repeat-associated protein
VNPAALSITYVYDNASQRASMNQSTGLFTYAHDSVGRITTLMNPKGQVTSWSYDAASRVKAMQLANGTIASNTYNNADQILLLANITSGGTTLSSFNYTYDPVGNRTQVVEANGKIVTLAYDPTYQLTNEQRSGANSYNISYVYDPVGNRMLLVNGGAVTTNTYNPGNELVASQSSAGVTTSTYDGSGNLLTSLAPGNQWTTNTWDGESRLTKVALPSGIVDSLVYNGDGQRVQKQDSAGTTKHVWDELNILLETNVSNVIQVVYTLEPIMYGNLISQSGGGVDSFYLFDALGSARQLASSAGTVTDGYIYDSFGNILAINGSTTNWFRYVGRLGYYHDVDLSQLYVRARMYVPAKGVFLSRDPLADLFDGYAPNLYAQPSITSLYVYSLNNPALLMDPSGLFSPVLYIPPALICLFGSLCAAFIYVRKTSVGEVSPTAAQSSCITRAVSAFGQTNMPKTANCAGAAGIGSKIPAGVGGETPLAPVCACPQYAYLSPSTAKCNDSTSLVDMISTLYHECVHTQQCATISTEKSRERDAYCDEAAFDHVKLLGLCSKGLCGTGLSQVNSCLAIVHNKRNESIAACRQRGGTPNYNMTFS